MAIYRHITEMRFITYVDNKKLIFVHALNYTISIKNGEIQH